MALKHLTVNAFLYEVIHSLNLPALRKEIKFTILFSGQSSKYNINFGGTDLIDTVYKRICAIEANREGFKKSKNTDDLQSSGGKTNQSDEGEQVITAEIDMVRSQMNQGHHSDRSHEKRSHEKRINDKAMSRISSRSKHRSISPKAVQPNAESSSCSIF
jgi:hypothetical protein